jgi:PTS system nitrogen regulatory IIA component
MGLELCLVEIAARIAKRSEIDEQPLRASLLHRESLGAAGIGHGVAIPHALLDVISSPVAPFTRLANPIDFGSADEYPVDLLFTLFWSLIIENCTGSKCHCSHRREARPSGRAPRYEYPGAH